MTNELSQLRLTAMRLLYLLTAIGVGYPAWSSIINAAEHWNKLEGVAYSFWAAFTALALLGVRFPVKMLPLLLLQLFYKLVWFSAVAYPLWAAGQINPMTDGMVRIFGLAVLFDLIIIPWPYVVRTYIVSLFNPSAPDQA